jgi:hypothetical protein
MAYRVKNADGEISFPQFGDLEKAYRAGLVDPTDEVLEEGQERWVKVGSIKLLKGSEPTPKSLFRDPDKRWYLIATALAGCGVLMIVSRSWLVAGSIGALVLFGLFAYTTKLGIKGKRSR